MLDETGRAPDEGGAVLSEIWNDEGRFVGRVMVSEDKGIEFADFGNQQDLDSLKASLVESPELQGDAIVIWFDSDRGTRLERLTPEWAVVALTLFLPDGYRAKFDSRQWRRQGSS